MPKKNDPRGHHCVRLKYFCKDFQTLCWTMETGELFKKNIENIKNSTFNFRWNENMIKAEYGIIKIFALQFIDKE